MDRLRASFDKKAQEYDQWIYTVCPFYGDVLTALVDYCPPSTQYVLDLGCGSGNVTHALMGRFPKMRATLVDISPKMLSLAKTKLKEQSEQIEYIEKDISLFTSSYTYDLVVSSLAMHHLEEKQKEYFCEKVLKHLVPGGYFFVIEQVTGGTRHFHEIAHAYWLADMKRNDLTQDEIADVLARKEDHDKCEPLIRQLERLKKVGFVGIDVLFKRDSIVLFAAQKY